VREFAEPRISWRKGGGVHRATLLMYQRDLRCGLASWDFSGEQRTRNGQKRRRVAPKVALMAHLMRRRSWGRGDPVNDKTTETAWFLYRSFTHMESRKCVRFGNEEASAGYTNGRWRCDDGLVGASFARASLGCGFTAGRGC
jgi:hypothetical protein